MKAATVFVRRGRRSDAKPLAEIRDKSWRFAYTGIIPGPALEKMLRVRVDRWWRWALTAQSQIRVLEFGDKVVGYATWGPCRKRELPASAEIYECYLAPEYLGVGFGEQLFKNTRIEAVRKCGPGCIVWALKENEAGCRFYEAVGGREVAHTNEILGGKSLEKIAYLWR